MDNLEKYIKDNQAVFDTETPRVEVWAAIENSLIENDLEKIISNNRANFDTEMPSLKLWSVIENSLNNDDILEKFISKNREAFDTDIPSLKLWAAVEKQTHPQPINKVVRMTWLRQAAAAIALLIVGAALGIYFSEKKAPVFIAKTTENVAPELKETEDFYTKKVESEYAKLVSYNPDPSVLADLKQIDEVQKELKKELENAPNSTKEEIIHRLIENYQIKLGILQRVLNHIEEHQSDNQKLQQQHEKI